MFRETTTTVMVRTLFATMALAATIGAARAGGDGYTLDDGTRTWFAQTEAARRAADEGAWEQAAERFEAVLADHPDNAYAAHRAAESWMAASRYREAAAGYRRARGFPEYEQAAELGVARACAALGDADCALEWLERYRQESSLAYSTLVSSEEFRKLELDPRYEALLAELKSAPAPRYASWASFSPDGSEIVYVARLDSSLGSQIYVTDLGTGDTRQVGRVDDDIVRTASWSPDGEWILIARDGFWPWADNLFLLRPDGRESRPLLPQKTLEGGQRKPLAGRDVIPTWSHDGRRITFVRATASEGFQVYVVDRDGGGSRAITDSPIYKENARFTTDDRRVCYDVPPVDEPDGASNYYVYCSPVDGEGETEVLHREGWWYRANWASAVDVYAATYWHSNNSRFSRAVLVDGDSGEVTVLTPPDIEASNAAVSPDGKRVVFGASRHPFNAPTCLYVVESDGSGMRPVSPLGDCLRGSDRK